MQSGEFKLSLQNLKAFNYYFAVFYILDFEDTVHDDAPS